MRLDRPFEAGCVGRFARLLRRLGVVLTRRRSEVCAPLLRRGRVLLLEGGAVLAATAAAPASSAFVGRFLLAGSARVLLRGADGSLFGLGLLLVLAPLFLFLLLLDRQGGRRLQRQRS